MQELYAAISACEELEVYLTRDFPCLVPEALLSPSIPLCQIPPSGSARSQLEYVTSNLMLSNPRLQ